MLLKIKRPLLILINILAFQVFFVDSIKLTTVERFTSNHSDPVTRWSILNHIVLDNKEGRQLLNDLYPIITELDEFSESAEDYYITEDFEEK